MKVTVKSMNTTGKSARVEHDCAEKEEVLGEGAEIKV